MIVPGFEKRSISEPPDRHRLSDSSAPSDIEELQFIDIPGSKDITGSRKSGDLLPSDKHFAQVAIFNEARECGYQPTMWSHQPQRVTCSSCHRTDETRVIHRPAAGTWCCCWVLCLVSGLCVFALCTCCQDTLHYCKHCNKLLGHRTVV